MVDVDELRRRARANAERLGFTMSSHDDTGRLLAVLAAGVRRGGRILELGTGVGFGTAALVAGLGARVDVRVVTIEGDDATAAAARDNDWPGYVEFVVGDIVELLPSLGQFDVVFADAQGGKWTRLDLTIAAVKPGGMLVVDDMEKFVDGDPLVHEKQDAVRRELLGHRDLVSCELVWSTGIIVSTKRING